MKTLHRRRLPRQERGIVLVIALILLGIVGITSTMAIRSAMEGDTISSSLRSVNLTDQAAEIALRWCELQTRNADINPASSSVVVRPAPDELPPQLWSTVAGMTANSVQVPLAVMSAAGLVNFPNLPQCMAEEDRSLIPAPSNDAMSVGYRSYVVTVRAFSPDYNRVGTNTAGSEVWLQSNLVLVN
jgi:type IV pilus assembly protein PilX